MTFLVDAVTSCWIYYRYIKKTSGRLFWRLESQREKKVWAGNLKELTAYQRSWILIK